MSKKLPFFPIVLISGIFLIGVTTLTLFASSHNNSSISTPFTHPSPTITPITKAGTLTLEKNIPQAVPNTSLVLTLTSLSVPSKTCRDCITKAIISVTNSSEETTITYISGGFAGAMPKKMTAFGYTFKVESIDSASIVLSYEK